MKDFLLIFRASADLPTTASPEEMQASMQKWMDWMGGIAAQNKLIDRGNRLNAGGKVVNAGQVVTDGPFMEMKEAIGGYTLIRAESLEEAAELSKGCPILLVGGNVEVREIIVM